ncbi:hypothetical protein ADUPG1_008992, partial [Aduncisulcus paluster]
MGIFSRFSSRSKKAKVSLPVTQEIVQPVFIHKGDRNCIPIPGTDPTIISLNVSNLTARNDSGQDPDIKPDQSYEARWMVKREYNSGFFTHISIPFSSPTYIKGAYICLWNTDSSPSSLVFTLKKQRISKKYEFHEIEGPCWFYLPIDLSSPAVRCEIEGRGQKTEYFCIDSLVFVRKETPKESVARKFKEDSFSKQWVSAILANAEYCTSGLKHPPVPRDDYTVIKPTFTMIKSTNSSFGKESKGYNQNSNALRMIQGKDSLTASHLSIPFPSPKVIAGVYICVHKKFSSPDLLFTFVHTDGTNTLKRFSFPRPKEWDEWYFLPTDLSNVVLCIIQGKGTWEYRSCRHFFIFSLFFVKSGRPEMFQTVTNPSIQKIQSSSKKTSSSPFERTPIHSSSTPQHSALLSLDSGFGSESYSSLTESYPKKEKERREEGEEEKEYKSIELKREIVLKEKNDVSCEALDLATETAKVQESSSKEKEKEKERKEHKPKHDSLTLTSASTLTPQCIIGSGGFGEVLLVKVDGIPFPCVLKKMLKIADEKVVKDCRKEFKVQLKLFNNPKCFNRIPRPLYILDLLDCDMKGIYGFLMEFCVGGSVSAFSKR